MLFDFEERLSDSPFVERIWRTRGERAGDFLSVATSHCELVVSQYRGETVVTMRGPETKATPIHVTWVGTEWFGIVFKLGTVMPCLPASALVDGSVDLPDASNKSFWLDSSAWPIPSYENADTFVNRLMRQGLLLCDPVVASVVRGEPQDLSRRSIQRHFLRATGLTHGSIRQIERARYATMLLQEGASIQETVGLAGYADQPHLTRTLKRFMGKTPAQIINKSDLIPNRDDKAAYSRVGRRGLAACGNSDFPESYREAQA